VAKEADRMAIQTMPAQLVDLWLHYCGQGKQSAKHHEQIHVLDDIDSLGAQHNYHTGLAEHNHIDNIKKLAKMAQRWKLVLDWQIANCHADSYILDLTYNAMNTNTPILSPTVDSGPNNGMLGLGSKGRFVFQHNQDHIDAYIELKPATDAGVIPHELSDYITQYCLRYHMEDMDDLTLPSFTEE
jgi:hypothetical protein